ncbi:DNA-directed DNA polymerase [Perilla frutescens var. hirtella]|uniref:DNA-directed DNA polymerase n=1 Tax=Perilla frutescens var. hirtella TaxID=608512 RepID=A0AAD4JPI7_PERFH|nr:DNA-directed DNA polymerase [Perilla frutescens var. hirtella]
MLGVHFQRSWIVLIVLSTLLLPIYIFASTILRALGQDEVIAKEAGRVALCEKQKKSSIDIKGTIAKLEKDLEESQRALRAQFHELASELKAEITKELLKRNVSTFSMTVVKRNYAFERSDIPHEENYVLKISYPFKDPSLPSNLKGNNFTLL